MSVSFTKQDALRIADRASDFYVRNREGSLTASVVDAVGDLDLNDNQIERVVQATNQAVWDKLKTREDPAKVRFDPARTSDVIGARAHNEQKGPEKLASLPAGDAYMTKTASSANNRAKRHTPFMAKLSGRQMHRVESALESYLKKTAGVDFEAGNGWDPRNELPDETSNWDRVYAKVAAAVDEVEDMIERGGLDFVSACDEVTRQAVMLKQAGVPVEEIWRCVHTQLDGDDDLVKVANLSLQNCLNTDRSQLEDFLARGDIESRVTIWDRPVEKTASVKDVFHSHLGESRQFRGDHPFVLALNKLASRKYENELLHDALQSLEEDRQYALEFVRSDEEMTPHV